MSIEKRKLKLGYIPLTDCLPLVAAAELGLFADEGLEVELSREASWSTVRDKLIVGELDGAQLLAPMALSATLGLGGLRKPMVTAFSLGLNGNAITVSNALFAELGLHAEEASPLGAAAALGKVVAQRRERGRQPLVLATVFPFSNHNYLLRYWLAAAGVDAGRDIKLVALPPSQMGANLRLGHIDGFCVGEPWNSCAVAEGHGRCLVTGYEIWQNAPEKVFGVVGDWAMQHPETHAALLRALDRACAWIDDDPLQALPLLHRGEHVDVPIEQLQMPFNGELHVGLGQQRRGRDHFHVFHRFAANFPWRSHACWMVDQMARSGQLPDAVTASNVIAEVWRSDIYRAVFGDSRSLPLHDYKSEGEHHLAWQCEGSRGAVTLGPNRLVDAAVYSPQSSPALA